jgi:hypothetical protein
MINDGSRGASGEFLRAAAAQVPLVSSVIGRAALHRSSGHDRSRARSGDWQQQIDDVAVPVILDAGTRAVAVRALGELLECRPDQAVDVLVVRR